MFDPLTYARDSDSRVGFVRLKSESMSQWSVSRYLGLGCGTGCGSARTRLLDNGWAVNDRRWTVDGGWWTMVASASIRFTSEVGTVKVASLDGSLILFEIAISSIS